MAQPTYPLVTDLLIDKRTRKQLGAQGTALLRQYLRVGDCQTCNRSLGEQPPAVVVADYGDHIEASLHHKHCRDPGWHDRFIVTFEGTATYVCWFLAMDVLDNGTQHKIAAVLINPGVERLELTRTADTWKPRARTEFGLTPVSEVMIWQTNPHARLRINDHPLPQAQTAVELLLDNQLAWTFDLEAPTMRLVREHGGLLVVISTSVDPNPSDRLAYTRHTIMSMIDHGTADGLWATLTR